jgi:elongator complex protein 3
MTVETRPDCLDAQEVDRLLWLGVTRVELGVQNVYDDVYELVERGHTVRDVVEATRLLKDSGLKVCYHMMPGLPGSDPERDLEGFRTIFEDARFRPDMLKIYPTLVIKGTKLYDWWSEGSYEPLSTDAAVGLVAKMKELVPPWVRIMRIQRDIPSTEPDPENLEVVRRVYEASEGVENNKSVEDEEADVLVGILMLRIPSEGAHRPEALPQSAFVRELHVYGRMVPVGSRLSDSWQHRGWGGVLMAKAERIASEEYGVEKLLVMSALGTKRYYERLGYRRDGVYVSKPL